MSLRMSDTSSSLASSLGAATRSLDSSLSYWLVSTLNVYTIICIIEKILIALVLVIEPRTFSCALTPSHLSLISRCAKLLTNIKSKE